MWTVPCLLGRDSLDPGSAEMSRRLFLISRRLFLIYSGANPQIKTSFQVCVGSRVVGVCWQEQRAAVTSVFHVQHLKLFLSLHILESLWIPLLNLLGSGLFLEISWGDAVGSPGNPPWAPGAAGLGTDSSGSSSTLAQEVSTGSLLGLAARTWHSGGNILCALRINRKIIKL